MAVITTVAYDFAPKGWALCNGQVLPINTNQALYSLLGTIYGGNGVNTFALPNLQGRVPVGTGPVQSGTAYVAGQINGTLQASLNSSNLPPHAHSGPVVVTPKGGNSADDSSPSGNFPGQVANGYNNTASTGIFMQGPNLNAVTIAAAGGGQPFSTLTPYAVVNYVICTNGIYPSRN